MQWSNYANICGIIAVSIFLLIQGYWDIRCKEIPDRVTWIMAAIGVCLSILAERPVRDMIIGVMPGCLCLVIGKVTNEAIGYGDGFLLCALGCYLNWSVLWSLCFVALLYGAVSALGLLVSRRIKGKDQIPFVPFLGLAWFTNMIGGVL